MVIGLSTCSAMTSMPWSAKALTASASFCGSHQPPVHTTVVVALGLTDCAPRVKALIERSSCGIWKAPMKPSLPVLLTEPAVTPARYMPSSESAQ